ncbi:MAG: ATP-binding protein, partial [Sporichthyaceae bacterium]|nr:ATP-binding protein [Sporichthyaceae bacterium]
SLVEAMLTTDPMPVWSPRLFARRLRVRLHGPDGAAVLRQARLDAAATLRAWQLEVLAEDACVIVDELVGNVLRHAPTTRCASVALVVDGDTVRIEVSDRSPQLPVLRSPGGWDEEGRGLQLVSGLASDLGWRRTPAGKLVWAALAVPGPPIYEAVRRGLTGGTTVVPRPADGDGR